MADEADRILKRKRIFWPTDSSTFVDIPVIYETKFVTAADQYQEGHFFFDNTSKASRKIRVQRVTNPTGGDYVDVERIQSFFTTSAAEQYQETEWTLVNTDPAPIQPDGTDDPAHQKKHFVRYFSNNDESSGTWIDVEIIDELDATLAQEQYQDYKLSILNADLGSVIDDPDVPYTVTKGFCDPNLELAPVENGLDPPYRLDPFQNIVNLNTGYLLFVSLTYVGSDTSVTVETGSLGPAFDYLEQSTGGDTFTHQFVFDVSMPSTDPPGTVAFSISNQDDYTDWVFSTLSGSSAGATQLDNLTGPPVARWVNTQAIQLYSKSAYHLGAGGGFPIQQNDMSHDPGPVASVQFGPGAVMPAINPTIPSTDIDFYPVPPGTGSIAANGHLVTGGAYVTEGLFKGGILEISYRSLAPNSHDEPRAAIWPSLPVMRDVDNVGSNGGLPGSTLVTFGDGASVYQPNPAPTFSYGVYRFEGKNGDSALYGSGSSPIDSNKYTGTYPPPSSF